MPPTCHLGYLLILMRLQFSPLAIAISHSSGYADLSHFSDWLVLLLYIWIVYKHLIFLVVLLPGNAQHFQLDNLILNRFWERPPGFHKLSRPPKPAFGPISLLIPLSAQICQIHHQYFRNYFQEELVLGKKYLQFHFLSEFASTIL